ncbi:MAG: hypothetical protein ACXWBS_03895 [Chthoniobacterales bacterium]
MSLQGPLKSPGMAELADAVDSKTVVSLPNELLTLVHVRSNASLFALTGAL